MVYVSKTEYICSVCDEKFKRYDRLTSHESTHTGERAFSCSVVGCSKSYTNVSHLKRHHRLSHEVKPAAAQEFLCEYKGCGRVLSNKYSLKKHHIQYHDSENKFRCTECSRNFRKKHRFEEHLAQHGKNDNVLYECKDCDTVFSSEYFYKKHIMYHKTFTCDCKMSFKNWMLLMEHKRTDCTDKTVHKCDECNKIFSRPSNLKQHNLKVHAPESQKELFTCSYIGCDRKYNYRKNLMFHVNIYHKKIPPSGQQCEDVQCYLCNLIFKTKRYLKQHLRKVHTKLHKKPRKDKGLLHKCIASKISGVKVPKQENLKIISESRNLADSNKNISEEMNADLVNEAADANGEIKDEPKDVVIEYCDAVIEKIGQEVDSQAVKSKLVVQMII